MRHAVSGMYMVYVRCAVFPQSSLAQFLDKSFYTYPFLISENFLRRA